jgi:hypothetical protein
MVLLQTLCHGGLALLATFQLSKRLIAVFWYSLGKIASFPLLFTRGLFTSGQSLTLFHKLYLKSIVLCDSKA